MTDPTKMTDTKDAAVPPEDLPLPERVKLADAVNPYLGIAPGWFVDARDTINNWCVAEVLRVDGNDLKLSFDGWSSKYDDMARMRSNKVCPFRLASRGYTGQVKIPLRRLVFSLDQLAEQRKRLEEVLTTEFRSLPTAFDVTQYIRGRLYTYVDFLMAGEYIANPEVEVPLVVAFLKLVAKLIALWLGNFPKYLKSFVEWQSYPKLILVDRNVALAACGNEVLDMLKWLFCQCPRTLVFFARYDMDLSPDAPTQFTKPFLVTKFARKRDKNPSIALLIDRVEQDEDMVYGLFVEFFETFCSSGGLKAVIETISAEKLAERASTLGLTTNFRLPIDVIAAFLAPFKAIKPIAREEVCKELAIAGKLAFFQRIESLEEKDIKDTNKETIASSLGLMKGFLRLAFGEEESEKLVRTHEMTLSLKFVQSGSLEKRLNGLADIRKLIERVEYTSHFAVQQTRDGWLNAEYLTRWIVENKILEMILNENAHAELIRRTSFVFSYLARKKALTVGMLELLWKCQQDKHEDIIRVIYDTIKDLLDFLSNEDIKFIFDKLKSIPLDSYDEKLITFMKDFTLKAYGVKEKNDRWSRMQDIDSKPVVVDEPSETSALKIDRTPAGEVAVPNDSSLYCVPIFWALLQDEARVPQPELPELAVAAFRETLAEERCYKCRVQYLYLCLENIKANRSVPQSVNIALYIWSLVNSQKMMMHAVSLKEYIAQLNKDYGLVELVLKSCEHYMRLVVARLESKQITRDEIADSFIQGKHKHSQNLECRLKFLHAVLSHGPKELKMENENLIRLWNLYVETCKSEYDTMFFLQWLSSEKKGAAGPVSTFDKDETLLLFSLICRDREKLARKYDLCYFQCFAKNFKLINMTAGTVELRKDRIRVCKSDPLIGLDALWDNVSYETNDLAREKFCELIIDVYTNLHESLHDKKREILAAFIDRCMGTIIKSDAEKDELKIANLSRLMLQLFNLVEGHKYTQEDDTEFSPLRPYAITVTAIPGNGFKKFEVEADITVGQLRKQIADVFHLPFDGFQMLSKTRSYEPEDNDSMLRIVGWSQQIQARKLSGESGPSPKMLVAQNHAYVAYLFLLLSKESAKFVGPVWDLLMSLPQDQKMLKDIEALNVPPEGWNGLLDSKSVHKFLYSLQIVENIVTPPQGMESVEVEIPYKLWLGKFCKKEGLAHLFSALINLPVASLEHPLTRKCFALLMRVLHLLQSAELPFEQHIPKYELLRPAMVNRVLTILTAFANYSIREPQDRSKQVRSPKKARTEELSSKPESLAKQKKKQEEESKALECGFALIKGNKQAHYAYFEQMVQCDCFKELLLKGLILSDSQALQETLALELQGICKAFKGKEYSPIHPHVVLIPFMLQNMVLETLQRSSGNCQHFYRLLCAVIKETPKTSLQKLPLNFHAEVESLAAHLKSHEAREHTTKDVDFVVIGLLNLLEALLSKFSEEKVSVGEASGIVQELLHHCLFEFPIASAQRRMLAALPPKCKSQAARLAAFNLLCTLARDAPRNLEQIIAYVRPIHAKGTWRTKRTTDWNIMPEMTEKSTTGYVGLKNLGCICYMNSLLQQMYMIPSFRNDILATQDPSKHADPDNNLLYQTQCLFAALNTSVKQYYNPKLFCHAFKDWDGKSINVLEQMDVDEFCNLFLDKIEAAIKGTPQADTIKYHFGGVFANQLLCKDCPHSSALEEPFLALNLQVKNKKSLQQCLESFVEGEMLQGNNAYHCEKCDKKVTTLKRVCIKRLPRHLFCVLKRFDLNYDTMQKFKINEYCEFPMRLNMEAFTAEGLAKKDREKEREKAKKEGRDLEEPERPQKPKYPPEYYEYKLTGVVIHMGNADAGHYYSLIMDREKEWLPEKERWYEFNDILVDPYNPEEIKDDAFGGEERITGFEGMSVRISEKFRNAYLLVYERVVAYDPPEEEQEEEDSSNKAAGTAEVRKVVATETAISEDIRSAIVAENVKYCYNRFMFHEDYFDFAFKLCTGWNSAENILLAYPSKNCDYHLLGLNPEARKLHGFQTAAGFPKDLQIAEEVARPEFAAADLKVFQYAATLLLTTLFRARNKLLVPEFIDIVKAYMNKHFEAAKWLLWQFTNSKVLLEYMLECTEADMRRLAVGLIYCAMLKVYEGEKGVLAECAGPKAKQCVLSNFAAGLFHQLLVCRKYTMHFEHFFQLFSRLVFLGPEMREYLLKMGAIKRLLGFWGSFTETNWNVMTDLPLIENTDVELGLSSEVDERFQSPFEEYVTMKRERICEQAQPLYTFLVEALSMLLRSTTWDDKIPASPYALPVPVCFKGVGMDPCIKTIMMNVKLINELVQDSQHSIAAGALVQAFAHLSHENFEYKTAVMKGLMLGLNATDYEDHKKYYFFLRGLLGVEDSSQIAFVDLALKELDTVMKNNQQAFFATFHAIKHIIWIAHEVKLVGDWYAHNPDKWEWLLKWLKENPQPSISGPGVRPYKSKLNNMRAMNQFGYGYSSERMFQMREFTQDLLGKLGQVKEGKVPETDCNMEEFSNLYYDKFLKNQVVELYDSKISSWTRSIVVKVLDEMLFLRPEDMSEKYAEWIEVDTWYLAREGTHAKEKPMVRGLDSSDESPSRGKMDSEDDDIAE